MTSRLPRDGVDGPIKIPDEQLTELKELQLSGCALYFHYIHRADGEPVIRIDVAHNNRTAPRFWYTPDGWVEGVVGKGSLRYSTKPTHTVYKTVIKKIRAFYSA